MGCGCNKNKQNEQFRKESPEQQVRGILSTKLGLVQSFAQAIVSRGFTNNKIDTPTKQLRVLSCFGNQVSGGELPPCQYLKPSETQGKFYCGGCGCGDKSRTWLTGSSEEYSKLDYPKLNCPLKMPGFTNYETSLPEEKTEPITRKYYIENIDYTEIVKIPVNTHEPPQNEVLQ
jgi:hypothetical protein